MTNQVAPKVITKRVAPGEYTITNAHGDRYSASKGDGENGDRGEWVIYLLEMHHGVEIAGPYCAHAGSLRIAKALVGGFAPADSDDC